MAALVEIDVNRLFNDYAKQVKTNKRLCLVGVALAAGLVYKNYELKKKDEKIESLTKENEELKSMKGE